MQFSTLFTILALYLSFVAADFHYGIAACSEAGGGYFTGGFILAKQHDTCLEAYAADKPGENIPVDAKKPKGFVCAHNVTIDLATLKWTSKSNQYGTPMSGKCTKLGKGGHGINSTCSPFEASCTWSDRVACSSHICD